MGWGMDKGLRGRLYRRSRVVTFVAGGMLLIKVVFVCYMCEVGPLLESSEWEAKKEKRKTQNHNTTPLPSVHRFFLFSKLHKLLHLVTIQSSTASRER